MAEGAATPTRLRIDFVSDVVCPWCAIGLASLEQALARTRGEVEAELHIQPFELNPQLGHEGEDAIEHLQKKYGMPAGQLAANQDAIRQRGAALGFTFDMERRRNIYNTFDAHRLLYWAGEEGKQRELKHALLRAYFTEGRNVSDHVTLVDIATGVGLPAERAREILVSGEYAEEVRTIEQFFQQHGIHAVPAVIIVQKHLISGGQPVEVFERALREIAAAKTA
ncbi:MAG TPA: DsbA family oxidoreductase [Luteimonas sp.]|nr:DsbA family oxidoreductase [Luteimonas sp.]